MFAASKGKTPFAKRQIKRIVDFSDGLNDKVSPFLLKDTEVAAIRNFNYDEKGTLTQRKGFTKRYASPIANAPLKGLYNFRKEDGTSLLVLACDGKLWSDKPNFVQLYDSQGEWETSGVVRDGITTTETAGDIKPAAGSLMALGRIVLGKLRLGGSFTYRESVWRSNTLDISTVQDKTTGRIVQAVNLPSGTTRTIETRYSTDQVTWTAWTALGAGDTIQGVGVNTFLQVRVRFTSTSGLRASVQSLQVVFDTTASATQIQTGLSTSARWRFATQNDTLWAFNGENTPQKWDGITATTSAMGGTPPVGKYVLTHLNRMYVAGVAGNRSRLYFSDLGNPESWPALNFVDVGRGDGDAITGLAVVLNQIVVTKDNSVWILQGDSPSTYVLRKASDEGGAVGMYSFGVVKNTVVWLSKDDVRLFDGLRSAPASEKIEKTFNALNKRQLALAAGVVHDSKYYLAVPNGASLANDLVLVFDTRRTAWTVYDGIAAAEFCIFKQFNEDTLLFGSSMAGQVYQMEQGATDDGAAIDAYVVTKALTPGGGVEAQALVRASYIGAAELESQATALSVSFFKDLSTTESQAVTASLAASKLNVERAIPSAAGISIARAIQIKIRHNELAKRVNIYTISLEFSPKGGMRAT